MTRTYTFIFCMFLLIASRANAQEDYILLPENFMLHKGEKLDLHLITANQFVKQDELNYDASQTAKFTLYAGSKKVDLTTAAKAGANPIISMPLENGLNIISMVRKSVLNDIESDDFLKILDDENLTQYSEKAKNSSKDSFRERYTWYMKTLVEAEKNSGNNFDKPLNEDYEIVLRDNPYKGNYGDDVIAQVRLKGKPVVNVSVTLYIKTANGNNIFAQKLSTDKQGLIYFKLTREGIYLLRSLYMEPSKDKSADYDTWVTTYSFAFSSSNEMPNTYKEFGFGNKH
jgi:hypothetical protein